MSLRAAFSVSGGVRYHLRGARYAQGLWLPYRQGLKHWLDEWPITRGGSLVIVGPSAGYCMSAGWLERFERIVCLDPDPLARWLFLRRVGELRSRVEWHRDNFLREPARQLEIFGEFLSQHPGAPVLFSGFLGQLGLLTKTRYLDEWKRRLVPELLRGRTWASFHDRVSGGLPPRLEGLVRVPARLTDAEIVERFYASAPGADAELNDHDTVGLFPAELPHAYLRWDLTPRWSHLIECVRYAQ